MNTNGFAAILLGIRIIAVHGSLTPVAVERNHYPQPKRGVDGMADMCGLEPHAARHKGSSPLLPTKVNIEEVMNESISNLRVCSSMRQTLL